MTSTPNSLVKSGGIFLPEAISTLAATTDRLYYFIFWLSLVFFVGLVGVTAYFIKTGRKPGQVSTEKQILHNHFLEVLWTLIPTLIVLVIFVWGFSDYLKMRTPPGNAMEIRVTGKKWLWEFEYPGGFRSINELVVPLNQPVKLLMSATDVLHSFYLPNLRIKKDLVPNRYTTLWFEANKKGAYQIFCTEFCGDGHSTMLAVLKVLPQSEYDDWLAKGSGESDDLPLDELGKKLFTSKGCNACHTVDGSTIIGPTWKGLYGKTTTLTTGKKVVADDNYIRRSMVDPQAEIVEGFDPVMPTYSGLLSDREINGIIEYIKTLK